MMSDVAPNSFWEMEQISCIGTQASPSSLMHDNVQFAFGAGISEL
jgi:hypothetical protein